MLVSWVNVLLNWFCLVCKWVIWNVSKGFSVVFLVVFFVYFNCVNVLFSWFVFIWVLVNCIVVKIVYLVFLLVLIKVWIVFFDLMFFVCSVFIVLL